MAVLTSLWQSSSADITLTGLDYITYIHATHFAGSKNRDPFLRLPSTGVQTGRRVMIVVVDSEYNIVYQQRVERFWNLRGQPFELG
jgi:hypothetical protein